MWRRLIIIPSIFEKIDETMLGDWTAGNSILFLGPQHLCNVFVLTILLWMRRIRAVIIQFGFYSELF